MIPLPWIGNLTAKELCGLFQESELLDTIAYLELVINKQVSSGAELFRLGIELNYSTQELWAVQNRLALGIHYLRKDRKIHTAQSCRESV
jgi:hypothetical protein